jgi:hypothetical protein
MSIHLFIVVGFVFGFLAAGMAFGITYIEWEKHKFTGWDLWREPLRRGVFTFVFFLLLSIGVGYVVPFIVQ